MNNRLVDVVLQERALSDSNLIFISYRKLAVEAPNILFLLTTSAVFFAIRYFVKYHVWRPFAIAYGVTKKSHIEKFAETAWYTCYYTTFLIFGCVVFYLEEWSLPTVNMWIGWPLQPFKPLFRLYYLLELTFYFHCMVALTFEKRRKDFIQTLIHHLSTFGLVGMSYWVGYFRIGLLILIVHNVSDVFLYLAKSMHYIANIHPKYRATTNSVFTFFGVSFFVSRLVGFPVLVWSAWKESWEVIGISIPLHGTTNFCLWVLLCLHVFWFYLIVRMARRLSAAGDEYVSDVRSDSEDEDEGDKPRKNAKDIKKKT